MARNVVIVQARMSSSRLPGKVLLPILGRPAILFLLERLQQALRVDEIVLATSQETSDNELAEIVRDAGAICFRGSLSDVLDRYYNAASCANADNVVRITGDCPLIDADLVDYALEVLTTTGADYVSNVNPPTFPDGLDVEAFTFEALRRAWTEATDPRDREHVTPYLREREDLFLATNFEGLSDFSRLRWTVDHPDDFDHVKLLLEKVGAHSPLDFDRFDLYRVCEREIKMLQQPGHQRNEGMQVPANKGDKM